MSSCGGSSRLRSAGVRGVLHRAGWFAAVLQEAPGRCCASAGVSLGGTVLARPVPVIRLPAAPAAACVTTATGTALWASCTDRGILWGKEFAGRVASDAAMRVRKFFAISLSLVDSFSCFSGNRSVTCCGVGGGLSRAVVCEGPVLGGGSGSQHCLGCLWLTRGRGGRRWRLPGRSAAGGGRVRMSLSSSPCSTVSALPSRVRPLTGR